MDARTEVEEDVSVADVLGFLKVNRVLILTVFVLCVGSAVAYAFLATPMYRSDVVVRQAEMDDGNSMASLAGQLGGLASLAGISLGGNSKLNDGVAILKSSRLAEEFIRSRKIEEPLQRRERGRHSIWKAVRKFKNDVLEVKEDKRNGTVTVSVTWEDPKLAADWANGLVAMTNEILRNRDKADAERSLKFLRGELARTNVVEMQKVLYNLIQNETKTLMLADARSDYALLVLDRAFAPEWKQSPKRIQVIAVGIVLGGVLALGLALLRSAIAGRRRATVRAG